MSHIDTKLRHLGIAQKQLKSLKAQIRLSEASTARLRERKRKLREWIECLKWGIRGSNIGGTRGLTIGSQGRKLRRAVQDVRPGSP